jgi:hypothetical protein
MATYMKVKFHPAKNKALVVKQSQIWKSMRELGKMI